MTATDPKPARRRRRRLRFLAVGVLLLAGAIAASKPSDLGARLLELSNEARADEGLPPLEFHEGLARAAATHAEELARRGVLTHESTEAGRETPGARVASAGVALVEVAENLAVIEGPDVATRAVEGWLESPGHRRNLLNEDYDSVGHGAAEGERGTYVVQVLAARPLTRSEARVTPVDEAADEVSPGDPVAIRITYEEEGVPLVLFVDGEHRAGALAEPGVLRTEIPLPEGPVRVSVGIDQDADAPGGTVRIVEEFELSPGPPPTLTPGAPPSSGGEEDGG